MDVSKRLHYLLLPVGIIISIFLLVFFVNFKNNGSINSSLSSTFDAQQFSIIKDIGTATTGKLFKVILKIYDNNYVSCFYSISLLF